MKMIYRIVIMLLVIPVLQNISCGSDENFIAHSENDDYSITAFRRLNPATVPNDVKIIILYKTYWPKPRVRSFRIVSADSVALRLIGNDSLSISIFSKTGRFVKAIVYDLKDKRIFRNLNIYDY